jgi:membrane-bound serine protease (ClpP class)
VMRWRRRMGGLLGTSTGPLVHDGGLAEVRAVLSPLGVVFAAGEEWSARTADGAAAAAGTTVRIIGQDGLTLIVEPVDRSD